MKYWIIALVVLVSVPVAKAQAVYTILDLAQDLDTSLAPFNPSSTPATKAFFTGLSGGLVRGMIFGVIDSDPKVCANLNRLEVMRVVAARLDSVIASTPHYGNTDISAFDDRVATLRVLLQDLYPCTSAK